MDEEELKKKIENMSPEELKEFQKSRCIFCQISSGNVQSKKIYEDDKVIAILDINPANPGHILVMPKEHYVVMPQIPDDLVTHLFSVVKKLSNKCLSELGVKGTSIFAANGVIAGQRAQHFMVHIIPRVENDNIGLMLQQNSVKREEILKIKNSIHVLVNQIFDNENKK